MNSRTLLHVRLLYLFLFGTVSPVFLCSFPIIRFFLKNIKKYKKHL